MVNIEITPADRKKYPYHTEGAIKGILFIQDLSTYYLAAYARGRDYVGLKTREALDEIMGGDTNTNWTMAQVAEELYKRGVIDEKEFDRLAL